MALVEDFLFDDDGDLGITAGDITTGPSDNQHLEDIMIASWGQFRQYPDLGVGLERFFMGNYSKQFIRKEIRREVQSDNFVITDLEIDGNLNINLRAKRRA
jgi:hypothetical protein